MDRNTFIANFEKDSFFDSFKQYWPEDMSTSSEVVSNYFTRTQIKNMDNTTADIAIKYILYNLLLEGWAKNIKNKGINKSWTFDYQESAASQAVQWTGTLISVARPGHKLEHSKEDSYEIRWISLPQELEANIDAICLVFKFENNIQDKNQKKRISNQPQVWVTGLSWNEFLVLAKNQHKNWLNIPATLNIFGQQPKTLKVVPSQLSFQTIQSFMMPEVFKCIARI